MKIGIHNFSKFNRQIRFVIKIQKSKSQPSNPFKKNDNSYSQSQDSVTW